MFIYKGIYGDIFCMNDSGCIEKFEDRFMEKPEYKIKKIKERIVEKEKARDYFASESVRVGEELEKLQKELAELEKKK